MALSPGTKLGPYQIVAPIGAGGMGEVYRARDTRLERTVAIKILPPHLAESPEAKQRFDREARAISSLNHPNICTLYDVGHQEGSDFLVMEYLEGETMADRLRRGPLPPERVLRYGIQICEGLETAHRNGVIHRDLKPGNIMLTKGGAKLLDFGLAKPQVAISTGAVAGSPTPPTPTMSLPVLASPTSPLTHEGSVVGTFQYIAPELLQGAEADARSDIFAIGCVLYEMLAGKPAFTGKNQASVIASILALDPAPVATLQPLTPPALDLLVANCLAKEPADRIQSAHDLLLQLRMIEATSGQPPNSAGATPGATSKSLKIALVSVTLFAIAAIVLTIFFAREAAQPQYSTHSYILPPDKAEFLFTNAGGTIAISPDGRRLAFTTHLQGQPDMLYVQVLNSPLAQPLSGTENAAFPFWSPDSRYIGFFADGKLKKIDADGGPPQTLCDAPIGRGGTWNSRGTIIFAPTTTTALSTVPESGGAPREVTELATSDSENSHRWPYFLPDGKHFLYFVRSDSAENSGIFVGALGSKERRLILHNAWPGIYANGYLLFLRDDTLMAQPFDTSKLTIIGNSVPLAEHLTANSPTVYGVFSASNNGVLILHTGGGTGSGMQLMWFDRSGKSLGQVISGTDLFPNPAPSPDGLRLAYSLFDSGKADIWVLDLKHQTRTRITFGPHLQGNPVWTPDGKSLIYSSIRVPGGLQHMYKKAADGTGGEETVLDTKTSLQIPISVSRDGRYLTYQFNEGKGYHLWVLPLFGDRKPFPMNEPQPGVIEFSGAVSPDGKWVAYASNESGAFQIYLKPFPRGLGTWQVSTSPVGPAVINWRADGKELFFATGTLELMAVSFAAENGTPHLGTPHTLFHLHSSVLGIPAFTVMPDGKRFIVNSAPEGASTGRPLTLITNWTADLKK
ncbi:MAG TPA: protein kinase [Terriglobales bacterium]|nr:protein kinase [Terriglobales bacterium]